MQGPAGGSMKSVKIVWILIFTIIFISCSSLSYTINPEYKDIQL